ncbi:hypothetical protein [Sphingopyxis terrae]|uniref:hypothetical protein n=1 Tax=Sphingopyxis terrae TaxID=33052 RepID=UPI003628804D
MASAQRFARRSAHLARRRRLLRHLPQDAGKVGRTRLGPDRSFSSDDRSASRSPAAAVASALARGVGWIAIDERS